MGNVTTLFHKVAAIIHGHKCIECPLTQWISGRRCFAFEGFAPIGPSEWGGSAD
jgi:hypothetical protein